jgi:hypothetical protein
LVLVVAVAVVVPPAEPFVEAAVVGPHNRSHESWATLFPEVGVTKFSVSLHPSLFLSLIIFRLPCNKHMGTQDTSSAGRRTRRTSNHRRRLPLNPTSLPTPTFPEVLRHIVMEFVFIFC